MDLAQPSYEVKPAKGPYDPARIGVCNLCGHATSKKGSDRKAEVAILDHFRDKHAQED